MLSHNDPIQMHVYTDFGRFYRVDDHQYPGVGTVLNASDSTDQQAFWDKWRSHPENVEYSNQAKNRGKLFHAIVENYFRSPNYRMDSLEGSDMEVVVRYNLYPVSTLYNIS